MTESKSFKKNTINKIISFEIQVNINCSLITILKEKQIILNELL